MIIDYLNYVEKNEKGEFENIKIPVRVTKYAFIMFQSAFKSSDLSQEEIDKIPEISKMGILLKYGIEAGCNFTKEENKWEDLNDALSILDYEDNFEQFVKMVAEFSGKDLKEKEKETKGKKKVK